MAPSLRELPPRSAPGVLQGKWTVALIWLGWTKSDSSLLRFGIGHQTGSKLGKYHWNRKNAYLGVRLSLTTESASPAVVESISLALDLSAKSRSSWYLQLRKSRICSVASWTVRPRTISPWRIVRSSSCRELCTSSRHRSTPLRRSRNCRHCSITEIGSK